MKQKKTKMKNYNIFFLLAFFTIGMLACDERFEEVNTNPNGISDVNPSHLFAKAVRESFRNGIQGGYGYKVASTLGHYYVPIQVDRYIDTYKEDLTGDLYESLFGSEYKGKLKYYNEIMALTGPGMEKEDAFQYAIADVMAVLAYAQLTDAYGSVPYFEGAFGNTGIYSPKYDTQDVIYADIIRRLGEDIETLKSTTGKAELGTQDPIYGGNPDYWVRFANSLRFRLAMRMRHVVPNEASPVITACLAEPLMESNVTNVVSENEDGGNSALYSPWYGHWQFYKYRISDRLVTQLGSTSDPRLPVFATPMGNGAYRGLVNGLEDDPFVEAMKFEHSFPNDYLVGKAAPTYLMTAAEIAFLKAECALFGLGDPEGKGANGHYRDAIRLALNRINSVDAFTGSIQNADIDAFLATPLATLSGTQEGQFEQIGTQMWLALVPNFPQAYAYMRRTGYPAIPKRDGVITSLGDTDGVLPSRILYPLSEKLSNNNNVKDAVETLGGDDLSTTRLWWDVRR